MKKLLCLLITLLCLIALFPAHADFGDYSGDSDYGGSDYDSSWDDDDSWSSSDHDYVSDSDGYGVDDFYIVVFTVGGILLIALIGGARSKKKSADGATPTPPSSLQPLSALADLNQDELCAQISNMYIRLQEAWAARDLSPVEPLLSAPLYAQTSAQLKRDFIDKGITSHMEHISVLDVTLLGCKPAENGAPDRLYACVHARFVNYLTNSEGKLVRGDRNDEIYMKYEWMLERSGSTGGSASVNCPNCGAPVDVNKSAKCPYCGTAIESTSYDWVVSQIKGLSRNTVKH